MMRTWTSDNSTIRIQHHSDYSGDADIMLDASAVELWEDLGGHQCATVHIPARELLAFAAEYIRSRRISQLEDASDDELFGMEIRRWPE